MTSAKSPYALLGEDGIRNLVSTFYDTMDVNPEFGHLRSMHADDLSGIKEKLSEYLIGWMGGPPIYYEKYGSVCMTEPHARYAIGPSERDAWLSCMDLALRAIDADQKLVAMLKDPLFRIADAVCNQGNSEP